MRQVNLARIRDPKMKAKAWAAIKRDWPELAEFLRSPEFAAMKAVLGCMPIVWVDDAGHICAGHDTFAPNRPPNKGPNKTQQQRGEPSGEY